MKRVASIVCLLSAFGGTARAAYIWQDDRDGNNLACLNVGTLQVNDLAGSGTRCVAVDSTGHFLPMSVPCGTGTITGVVGTSPISCSGSPVATCGIVIPAQQIAYGTGTNMSSSPDFTWDNAAKVESVNGEVNITAAAGFINLPNADNTGATTNGWIASAGRNLLGMDSGNHTILNASIAAGGEFAFVNGATYANRFFTVSNAGVTSIKSMAAPATPAAGWVTFYGDSTSHTFSSKDDAGNVTHGVRTQACPAHEFATSILNNGNIPCTQPDFSDLSGSSACAQLPALTGAITTSAGTCGTSYAGLPAASQVMLSAGPTAIPVGDSTYTFDTALHVQAAGNAVGINGASVPTNASLVCGHTTNADRDRVQFNVGGGALGATGTSDNTFVDVNPSNTTIRTGVTAGIYATERIRAVSYANPGSSVSMTEAATVYIDNAPTIGGLVSSTAVALHVAGGQTKLGGNLTCTTLSGSGNIIVAADTSGTVGIAGVGGLPAAVSGTLPYYINVAGSTLVTGGAVWLGTSSTAGQGGTALEYVQSFAATNVALNVRIITNAITSGTLAVQITRNGSSFSTITLNNVSAGNLTTGTVSVGSPSASDRWGVLVSGTGTGMTGNMIFTANLLMAPNIF